ncbi:FAD-dependent oxidoreductase [Aquabacter spiritensis]|uniref:2-polyprenyl-6-methoxyphenol hydroxylase-like FAD-dependent oxidoreductase n=1 Tax=Aquabacter spiritensis TaxID=933073 RepID=A0A4R3M649_9HYPH|nr:NAD(P)/FAD-dependent oxidoreductase [Aquabacter spiritensis]TCT07739.1 2-polyprenyl-6-methoxyphenol hydroxylase-like FAD-dependent oxidoreductase [Aquabacter spiritensis]
MKIIIAGAGIGGMALAALLRQRGAAATLCERAESFDQSGYMIGLYPLGARVLHGLGLMDDFKAARAPFVTYTVCNGHGEEVHSYDIGAMLDQFGASGCLMRGTLLDLMRTRCADLPLHFGTRVEDFVDDGEKVTVTLSDGATDTCDLLIGADGIHSTVRRRLFGDQPDHETGWGCWVWIARHTDRPATLTKEYWGAGRFLGLYPIKGAVGVVAAGRTQDIGPDATRRDGRKVKQHFAPLGPSVADLFAELPDDLGEVFWWNLSDFRAARWVKGRVALLGDAACAFLPTAGVGASMALESAAVMDDELGRTDAAFLPGALARYETRRSTGRRASSRSPASSPR